MSVLVEFVGHPGSGKTTISRGLSELIRKDNKSVSEPTYLRSHQINDLHQAMVLLNKSLKQLFNNRISRRTLYSYPWSSIKSFNILSNVIRNSANRLAIYDDLQSKSPNEFIVLDQGLIQNYLSFALKTKKINKSPEIQKYIKKQHIINNTFNRYEKVYLVYISCDKHILESRLEYRSDQNIRFGGLNIDETHEFYTMAHRALCSLNMKNVELIRHRNNTKNDLCRIIMGLYNKIQKNE